MFDKCDRCGKHFWKCVCEPLTLTEVMEDQEFGDLAYAHDEDFDDEYALEVLEEELNDSGN